MTLHPLFRFVTLTSCLGLSLAILPVSPDLHSGLRLTAAWADAADPDATATDEDPVAEEDPEEMPELEVGELPDEGEIAPIDFDDDGEEYAEWLARESRRNEPAPPVTERSNDPKVTWDGVLTMVLAEDQVEFRDHVSGRRSHTVGLTAPEAKALFDSLSSLDPETARTKAGFSG